MGSMSLVRGGLAKFKDVHLDALHAVMARQAEVLADGFGLVLGPDVSAVAKQAGTKGSGSLSYVMHPVADCALQGINPIVGLATDFCAGAERLFGSRTADSACAI